MWIIKSMSILNLKLLIFRLILIRNGMKIF